MAWPEETPGPLGFTGLEGLVGVETILDPTPVVTPYVGLAGYWPSEWVRLEFNAPTELPLGRPDYRFSISVGGSW